MAKSKRLPVMTEDQQLFQEYKKEMQLKSDYADYMANEKLNSKEKRKNSYGVSDYLAPVLSGLTFGAGDELTAIGNAVQDKLLGEIPEGQGFMDAYAVHQKRLSNRGKQFAADKPSINMAANTVGGLASGGAVGAAVKGGLSGIKQIASLGALEGAAAGAGYADPGERLQGAAIGGLTGGALGAGLGKFTEKLAGIPKAAQKRFRQAMDADGMTESQLMQQMNNGNMPSDLGDNMTAQARAMHMTPGEGKTIINDALKARQDKMGSNIVKNLKDSTGANYETYKTGQDLIQESKNRAGPLYAKASASLITPSHKMIGMLDSPKMKGIFKSAKEDTLGYDAPQSEGFPTGNFDFWNNAKKNIDDKVSGKIRTGENYRAGKWDDLRKEIINEVDPQTGGAWEQARKIYSGNYRMNEALQYGESSLNKNRGEVQAMLKSYNPAEKRMFSDGLASKLKDKIETSPETANLARNLVKSPKFRESMSPAFKDTAGFDKFIDDMNTMARQGETFGRVTQGSRTAENMAAMEGFDPDIWGAMRASTNPALAAIEGGAGIISKGIGKFKRHTNAKTAKDFSKMLTETDPEKLKRMLEAQYAASVQSPAMLGGLFGALGSD